MSKQRNEDIYVIMSGVKLLHAVKTKRQAEKFVRDWESMCQVMATQETESNLTPGIIGWQQLTYVKIKLIYPRELSADQMDMVRKAVSGGKSKTSKGE